MRDYTRDVEARLERAHQAIGGGAKKYGYENIGARNMEEFLDNNQNSAGLDSKAFDRNLNRMSKHATQFLKQNGDLSTTSSSLPKIDTNRMPKIVGRVPSGR